MKLIVLLMLVFSTSVFALDGLKMNNLKFDKVGLRLGMYDGTLGFGVIAPMGNLYKDFGFATTLDYSSEDSASSTVLGLRSCYKLKDVNLMPNMNTYVGAGLAVHHYSFETSLTKIGIDGFAGVGYKLNSKMCVKGEVAYRMLSDYAHLALTGAFVYTY